MNSSEYRTRKNIATPGSFLFRVRRFKRIDISADKLRELMKLWNNKSTLKHFCLPEAYVHHREAVLLIMSMSLGTGSQVSRDANKNDGLIPRSVTLKRDPAVPEPGGATTATALRAAEQRADMGDAGDSSVGA
jgi:hypothetical protein